MAIAVEESGLLTRIALIALNLFGPSDRLLLLGFMIPTAFCSMWISNTATTAMMIKTVEAVLAETEINTNSAVNKSNYGTFQTVQSETDIDTNLDSSVSNIETTCDETFLSHGEVKERYTDKDHNIYKHVECQNKHQQRYLKII